MMPLPVGNNAPYLKLVGEQVSQHLRASYDEGDYDKAKNGGALIFSKQGQESFPRSLVYHDQLNSSEIHTWMILRAAITPAEQYTPCPTQEALAAHLGVSRPIIGRNIKVLRLMSYVSLYERVRAGDGRYLGSIYILHDTPMSKAHAMMLDGKFESFVIESAQSTSERVAYIARLAAQHYEITLPDVSLMTDRLAVKVEKVCAEQARSSMEKQSFSHVKNLYMANINDLGVSPLRSSSNIYKNTTTSRVHVATQSGNNIVGLSHDLKDTVCSVPGNEIVGQSHNLAGIGIPLPAGVTADQAARHLEGLSKDDARYLIAYLADRMANPKAGKITNPHGYLAVIARKFKNGDLNPAAYGQPKDAAKVRPQRSAAVPSSPGLTFCSDAEREQWQQKSYAEQLKRYGFEVQDDGSVRQRR